MWSCNALEHKLRFSALFRFSLLVRGLHWRQPWVESQSKIFVHLVKDGEAEQSTKPAQHSTASDLRRLLANPNGSKTSWTCHDFGLQSRLLSAETDVQLCSANAQFLCLAGIRQARGQEGPYDNT